MITVTVNDGPYIRTHQLNNDADISDLIEVLEQYRHNAVALPATCVSIDVDDTAEWATDHDGDFDDDEFDAFADDGDEWEFDEQEND